MYICRMWTLWPERHVTMNLAPVCPSHSYYDGWNISDFRKLYMDEARLGTVHMLLSTIFQYSEPLYLISLLDVSKHGFGS